jgi:hypothetical protein
MELLSKITEKIENDPELSRIVEDSTNQYYENLNGLLEENSLKENATLGKIKLYNLFDDII